jgi:hypothetical protein
MNASATGVRGRRTETPPSLQTKKDPMYSLYPPFPPSKTGDRA